MHACTKLYIKNRCAFDGCSARFFPLSSCTRNHRHCCNQAHGDGKPFSFSIFFPPISPVLGRFCFYVFNRVSDSAHAQCAFGDI